MLGRVLVRKKLERLYVRNSFFANTENRYQVVDVSGDQDPLMFFLKKFGRKKHLLTLFEFAGEIDGTWSISYKALYAAWELQRRDPSKLRELLDAASTSQEFIALTAFN